VLKYIIRRLLLLPVILFLVTLILFFLILRLPAEQRVMIYIPSFNPHITDEEFEKLIQRQIERYGLDDPVPVQYVRWMEEMIGGGWGYSPTWRQPVLEGLQQRVPATLELALYAMVPAILLSVGLGSVAARRHRRLPDHVIRGAAFVAWAFPPFILALILLNVFYGWLGWFPAERMSLSTSFAVGAEGFHSYTGLLTVDGLLNGRLDIVWDALRHLVLPAFTLALTEWALLTRIMRSSLLDVLGQEYVTTARAKGVRESKVISRHARRNAILPVISAGGVATSMLITSLVVVEVVFSFNGVGRWAVQAILNSDVPVAVGFALFSCTITVLASLLADILYAVTDPRVRLY
jgi:ABC-type dipeptide/oligopeptide/nickel transport system permease component